MKICILGGGNIGTLLIGDLGKKEEYSVKLLTSRPNDWSDCVQVYDRAGSLKHNGYIEFVSNNPEDVLTDADIIISTLPSHVFPKTIRSIKPFIKDGSWIGVMPGGGGSEFYCEELIRRGCVLFGFQRVHGIARIREYGKSVYDLGRKEKLFIAAIPTEKTLEVCQVVTDMLDIQCIPLPNYLTITLTPSNPILHTTRLYTLFKDYKEGSYWDKIIPFYAEWDDKSSEVLFACDKELQAFCTMMTELDLSNVRSLSEHYESKSPKELTAKISSIEAFKNINTPMKKTSKGYIPDFKSRYFQEDFPYGLCIIKAFCEIAGLNTPTIDEILMWFEKVIGVEYFLEDKFVGKDLTKLPLPQNFGLKTVEDVVRYYE